jgi:ABC-2 type transport system ATP-binding protein
MDDVVDQCLIGDVSRQVIGTLSKGYRQRVGLAGALIHRPPVLILDEPTVGLDPNQIIKVRELITELGRDHTVLLSTHILPEVEQVCERVFIIDRGRIVADGAPDALRTRFVGNPTLAVELEGADSAATEALQRLPGVVAAGEKTEGCWLLEHSHDADPREAVFRLAVEKGWVLLGLSAEKATLEDVFVRLTTREETVAEEPAEEVAHA